MIRLKTVGPALLLSIVLAAAWAPAIAAGVQPNFFGVWAAPPGTAASAPGGGAFVIPDVDPPIPYNDDYRAQFQAVQAKVKGGAMDMGGWCQPPGMPQVATIAGRFQFAEAPGILFILYETQSQIRRVFIDGKHPNDAAAETTLNGHSIGHWEGDTLVIDTIGMKDFTFLSRTGAPHSDEVHSVERWKLADKDTLSLDMVVTDPGAFTAPWHVARTFKRQGDEVLGDYECNENPRHQMSIDGRVLNVAPAN